jgi:hypothetical protein
MPAAGRHLNLLKGNRLLGEEAREFGSFGRSAVERVNVTGEGAFAA